MLESGRWYASPDCDDEEELVEAAIKGLGLDYLGEFDPNQRIIEWALKGSENMKTLWMEMTVIQAALASSSPTPGGGTAAQYSSVKHQRLRLWYAT